MGKYFFLPHVTIIIKTTSNKYLCKRTGCVKNQNELNLHKDENSSEKVTLAQRCEAGQVSRHS